jgi:hypothetical protein
MVSPRSTSTSYLGVLSPATCCNKTGCGHDPLPESHRKEYPVELTAMGQEIGRLQRLEQLGDRLCPIFKRMQYAAHSLSGGSSNQ